MSWQLEQVGESAHAPSVELPCVAGRVARLGAGVVVRVDRDLVGGHAVVALAHSAVLPGVDVGVAAAAVADVAAVARPAWIDLGVVRDAVAARARRARGCGVLRPTWALV